MSTLPVELFRYTLEQVPFAKRDLCSLARVSQYLQPEAERLLYHHIEVENYLDIVKACKAICRTERYGPLIRRFDIRFDIVGPWYHGVTTLHTHWIYVRTFIKLLAATLQRMVSLEILHIFLPEDLAYLESSCLGFFERCTFRLTTLGSRFSIDRHLLSFLAQQPDIVCLELYNRPLGPGINVLPFNLLPRLTTLGTYFYNDGLHFVSGHSITNLAIGFVRIENIRLFLRSFTSIKVLDMTIRADWDQVLGVIGEAIPALEVLFLPFATVCAALFYIWMMGHLNIHNRSKPTLCRPLSHCSLNFRN
jgi:hypothetical protein